MTIVGAAWSAAKQHPIVAVVVVVGVGDPIMVGVVIVAAVAVAVAVGTVAEVAVAVGGGVSPALPGVRRCQPSSSGTPPRYGQNGGSKNKNGGGGSP